MEQVMVCVVVICVALPLSLLEMKRSGYQRHFVGAAVSKRRPIEILHFGC